MQHLDANKDGRISFPLIATAMMGRSPIRHDFARNFSLKHVAATPSSGSGDGWSARRQLGGPEEWSQIINNHCGRPQVEQGSIELQTHIASLRRYAMALVGNTADADDLVQETLHNALAYMRRGRKIRNLRGYLFTILHNARISQLRRSENGVVHLPVDEMAGALPVEASQHHRAELRALLRELAKLPEEQRQVVLLVCVEGLSYREAAAVIGIPIGTVMSRLSRARQALLEKTSAEKAENATLKMVN